MSLRFIMSGVNVKAFADWITEYDTNRDVTTTCTVDGRTYVSTAYTWDSNINWALKPIIKRAITDGIITEEDSNYFQLFSIAGTADSIGFNAPRIISKNISRSEAYIQGRESILRLSMFCKTYLKGFEHSHISSIANTFRAVIFIALIIRTGSFLPDISFKKLYSPLIPSYSESSI